MMKRKFVTLLSLILSAVMLLAFGIVLAACGEENEPPVDETHQHTFEWTVKTPATCSQEGEEVQVCKECKEEGAKRPIAKTAHKYEWQTVKAATCSEAGSEKEVCSVCKAESGQTRTVEMTAHTPGSDLKVEGNMHFYTCTVCGAKINEEPHKAKAGYLQDEENNQHYQVCEVCNAKMNVSDHTPGDEAKYTADDHYYECTACGAVAEREDHIYSKSDIKVDAQKGTHYYECTVCHGHVNEEAHQYEWQTVEEADCQKQGSHKQVCTVCQAEGKTEATEKTGHKSAEDTWIEDAEKNQHYQICDVCETEFNRENHISDGKWSSDVDGHFNLCEKCGVRMNTADHTYDSGKTTCNVCGKEGAVSVEADFTFEEIDDGAAYAVTGYTGDKAILVIPSTHENKPVTQIAAKAFYDSTDTEKYKFIERVQIPASITEIGASAFCATGLTKVDVPKTVLTLGNNVFQDCSNLKTATGFEGVTVIPQATFRRTALESFTIPASVTEIGNEAFSYLPMKSIFIPDNVTKMGSYVFKESELTSITGFGGFTTLPRYALGYMRHLAEFTIPANITELGAYSVCYYWDVIEEIRVPDTVVGTLSSFVSNCPNLKRVYIGRGITEFGSQALSFGTNAHIEFVVIPNTIQKFTQNSVYDSHIYKDTVIYYEGDLDSWNAIEHVGSSSSFPDTRKVLLYSEKWAGGFWHYTSPDTREGAELWTDENNPKNGNVYEINFTQDRYVLNVAQTENWSVTLSASVNSDATVKDVIYTTTVSDTYLTLDASSGVLTAKAFGLYTITAKAADNPNIRTTCEVLVYSDHIFLTGTINGEDVSATDNFATYGFKQGADETEWVLEDVTLKKGDLISARYSTTSENGILTKDNLQASAGFRQHADSSAIEVTIWAVYKVTIKLDGEKAHISFTKTGVAAGDTVHTVKIAAMNCGDSYKDTYVTQEFGSVTGQLSSGVSTIKLEFTFEAFCTANGITGVSWPNMCFTVAVDGAAAVWYDENGPEGLKASLSGTKYSSSQSNSTNKWVGGYGWKVWYNGTVSKTTKVTLTFTFNDALQVTNINIA